MAKIRSCVFDVAIADEHVYIGGPRVEKSIDAHIIVEFPDKCPEGLKPYDEMKYYMDTAEAELSKKVAELYPCKKHTIYYWTWLADKEVKDGG